MGLLVGRIEWLLVVLVSFPHLYDKLTYAADPPGGSGSSGSGGSGSSSSSDPSLATRSTYDVLTAFAGNYGNALAEFAAQSHTVVATGSLENLSKYTLRLVKCTNTQGAMIHPFPITVIPGAEISGISGYGKKIKAPDPVKTDNLIKDLVNKGANIFKKAAFKAVNYMNLNQTCQYALYDGLRKKEDNEGTNLIKLSIVLEQNMYAWDTLAEEDPRINPYNKDIIKKESSLKIEFCTTEASCEDFNYERMSYEGTGLPFLHRLTGTFGFTAEQVHMKRCSENMDLCVEAAMGTGNKPRFRFSVVPFYYADMAGDAQKNILQDKKNYCQILTYTYQIGRKKTGVDVDVSDERRDEQEKKFEKIDGKRRTEPKAKKEVYDYCMGNLPRKDTKSASGQTRTAGDNIRKLPAPENPKPHIWIPKVPKL